MATLHRSSSFLLLPSHKLQGFNLSSNTHHYPPRKDFRFCVCSAKNSRRGKKVKSDVELCNDIREFLSAFGLPEDHVPTMKELSAHGRTDLAHVVRRRGYKFVRDLLSNSMEAESNGFDIEEKLTLGQDTLSYLAEGQDGNVEDIIKGSSLSAEISVIQDSSTTASIIPECNYSDHGCIAIESSISESRDAEWQTDEAKSIVKEIASSTPSYSIEQQDEVVRPGVEDSSLSVPSNSVHEEWQSNEFVSMVKDTCSLTPSRSLEQDEEAQHRVEYRSLSITSDNLHAKWHSNEVKSMFKESSSSKHSCGGEQQDTEVQHGVEDSSLLTPSSDNENAEWKRNEVKSMIQEITSSSSSYDIKQLDEEVQHGVEDSSMLTSSDNVEHSDREIGIVEDDFLPTEVFTVDNPPSSSNAYPETNFDVMSSTRVETSVNDLSDKKALKILHGQDEKSKSMAENISLPAGVSLSESPANYIDIVPGPNSAANSSLEDKVAKFIQSGDLDAIEEDVHNILDEVEIHKSKGINEQENEVEIQSNACSEENFEHVVSRSNAASASNGSLFMSEQFRSSVRVNHHVRNDDLSAESLASSDVRKDMDNEASKRENQVQLNRLKFLLHQKELELSHLKEQIEKEKLALSDLQMKAEKEISKAKKLVSEKDTELVAAEESLSGLVEVNIQYSGDGEIVEVAGSFNGWHHQIKMDPQPFSNNADRPGSRKSRLWSTMLWLYPGVYEIKFIVDGHWTLDPDRESITKSGICNNILRVSG